MRTSRITVSVMLVGFGMVALHCGGATTGVQGGDAGTDGGRIPGVPDEHRPSAPTCSPTRPPGIVDAGVTVDSGIPGTCEIDADCTQGKNGRCGRPSGNRAGNYCSYDLCFSDAECGADEACSCEPTGNRCVPGNCRVDADCGPSGYCSPTPQSGCGGLTIGGYYCHTAGDECAKDADCKSSQTLQPATCVWAPTSKKWTCQVLGICAG